MRKAAVRLIANALLSDGDAEKLTYTEADYFARCLDTLSNGALEVLGHALRLRVDRKLSERDHNQRIALDDLLQRVPRLACETRRVHTVRMRARYTNRTPTT